MKPLNTMLFVVSVTEDICRHKDVMRQAETYDDARIKFAQLVGFIDCINTFNNTMVDADNNDFTAEMSDNLDRWMADAYQTLAECATNFKKPADFVLDLLQKRDEYLT